MPLQFGLYPSPFFIISFHFELQLLILILPSAPAGQEEGGQEIQPGIQWIPGITWNYHLPSQIDSNKTPGLDF